MHSFDDSELDKMRQETTRELLEEGERIEYLKEGHEKGTLTAEERAEYEQLLKEAEDLTDEELAEILNI